MSKTELARFITEYLPQHPELNERIDARRGNQKLAADLAALGAGAGFDFSESELLETLSAMPGAALSDHELEAVTGGSGEAFAKVDLEYKEQKPTALEWLKRVFG